MSWDISKIKNLNDINWFSPIVGKKTRAIVDKLSKAKAYDWGCQSRIAKELGVSRQLVSAVKLKYAEIIGRPDLLRIKKK